ncbi:MAG TPA: hypothetical protein VGG39_22310 [Polyangiaceae bacterium]
MVRTRCTSRTLLTLLLGAAVVPLTGALASACGSPFLANGSDSGLDAQDDVLVDRSADGGTSADAPTDRPSPGDALGEGPADATNDVSEGGASDASIVDASDASDASVDAPPQDSAVCATGETCTAAPPQGWAGPIAFYEGAGSPPSCPPGASAVLTANAGLVAPPAVCSSCSCTGSVSCAAPTLSFWTNSSCSGNTCATGEATGNCTPVTSNCATGASVYVSVESDPSGAGCAPSQEVPTLQPTTWSLSDLGCAGPETSCGAGEACAPDTGSPFHVCVYRAGDLACPTGTYQTKHTVYGGVSDTRSCSPCACGAASGATCSGGTVDYSPTSTTCASAGSLAVPTSCHDLGPLATAQYGIELGTQPTLSNSVCTPSGGNPTGAATGTNATTVCCQ